MKTRDEALKVWADLCSQVEKDHPWYKVSEGVLGKVEKPWSPGYLFGGKMLKGSHLGRGWETVAYVHRREYYHYRRPWGLAGELLTQTYFRGAPPGREAERAMPFFFLGPLPLTSIGKSAMGALPFQIFRQFGRPNSKDSSWIIRTSRPRHVLGKASYPKMQDLLHSAPWLAAYDQWSSIPNMSNSHPFIAGLVHKVQFALELNEMQSPEWYSKAIGSFIDLVETIETGFDALRPAELEFSKVAGDLNGVPIENFTFQCPKCGKLEQTSTVYNWAGRVVNYKTRECGSLLFASERH